MGFESFHSGFDVAIHINEVVRTLEAADYPDLAYLVRLKSLFQQLREGEAVAGGGEHGGQRRLAGGEVVRVAAVVAAVDIAGGRFGDDDMRAVAANFPRNVLP